MVRFSSLHPTIWLDLSYNWIRFVSFIALSRLALIFATPDLTFQAPLLVTLLFYRGVRWSSDVKAVHFQSRHEKLGLALFVLVIVQGILGEISHLIMVKKGIRTGYFHILMGVTIFGLSIWEIKMGLDEWSWNPSKGVTYFVSFFFLEICK